MNPQELQRALQGLALQDGDSFAKIYRHYRDQIFRFSRTLLRDDASADEVTGDVFIDLLEKPIGYSYQSKFSVYLCGIAKNKAFDRFRKKKLADSYHHVDIDDEDEYLEIPDASRASNPELSLEDRQSDVRLRRCMDRLPDAQREAIAMRYDAEMTETEIAKEMKCAVGTVKSRLSTARASLQKCFGMWRQEVHRA